MDSIFLKIEEHLLDDLKPSLFLRDFILNHIDKENPLYILKKLESILQEPKHHPEGDVLEHTMQVVDIAAKYRFLSNNKREFMWSALLHDIGKIKATKLRKGRWTAYNHDSIGFSMTKELLEKINLNKQFIDKVSLLVKNHMIYLYITKNLPFGDSLEDIYKVLDLNDLFLLILSDRLGRNVIDTDKQQEILASLNNFIQYVDKKLNKDYNLLQLII